MTDEKRALTLLHEITAGCKRILGDNLTGVYAHGSLAFGCFTWATGDIDFLIVVQRKMTQKEKTQLIAFLLKAEEKAPAKGLEMSVMLLQHCRNFTHPAPYELHYSKFHRAAYEKDLAGHCQKLQGADPDLAAHVTVISAVGLALYGSPIKAVFGPVTRRDYLGSILGDVENACEDVRENPVYITLNLCRVLCYLQEGRVLSKRDGGDWGMAHLPACYRELLSAVLMHYAGEQAKIDRRLAQEFAQYALKQISQYGAK